MGTTLQYVIFIIYMNKIKIFTFMIIVFLLYFIMTFLSRTYTYILHYSIVLFYNLLLVM